MKKPLFFFLLLFTVVSCDQPTDYKKLCSDSEFIHRSLRAITDRIVHDIFSPPVASRIYAYSSIAAFEAIIHQDSSYISLAGQLHGLERGPQPEAGKEYCYTLAATEAMLRVGKALIFSEKDLQTEYDKIMDDFKKTGIPRDVFDRSVAYGNEVASHVLSWSSGDNYKQSRSFPKYSILMDPATWRPTPPAYMDAIEPHWNKIRTFVMDSAAQFKPVAPTTFSLDKSSTFFEEAKEVYEVGKSLTDEQRDIAFFWDCNPFMMNIQGHVMFATKKISPGGHWINITRTVCTQAKKDVVFSVEAYAKVSLSIADGFISCWDEKYRSVLVRPETYINQYIDENWVPVLQTPPFPEYTSGHSVISNAASIALTKLMGENVAFTDSTEVEFGLTARAFKSFKEAAAEAAISRLYGGIHYRPAVENGSDQGIQVGEFIANKIRTRREYDKENTQ